MGTLVSSTLLCSFVVVVARQKVILCTAGWGSILHRHAGHSGSSELSLSLCLSHVECLDKRAQ